MSLRELLIERRSALCARWLDAVLAEYGEVTAARWRKEKDRFANPVGHALSDGLPLLLDAVVGGRGLGERGGYTQPVGFGRPATLQAPLAGPDGKSS